MAVRYLCPVCDQELRNRRFCPTCRKWVKKPVVYTGGSLPNEEKEDVLVAPVSSERRSPERKVPVRPVYRKPPERPVYENRTPGRGREASSRAGSAGKNTVMLVIIIWIVVVFFISVLGAIF